MPPRPISASIRYPAKIVPGAIVPGRSGPDGAVSLTPPTRPVVSNASPSPPRPPLHHRQGSPVGPLAVSEELRRQREELVIEHMETENRHEYEATIETFDHPRYELVGTGDV